MITEDAPALDSLQKYEVVVKEGGVYVLVDEESLKSTRCHPPCAKYEPNECKETVVIIGGGASGAAAAQKLREVICDLPSFWTAAKTNR